MFLQLVNPTVILHAEDGVSVEDRPPQSMDVIYLRVEEIALVRSDFTKKIFMIYLRNHHKFNCLISNPDQYYRLQEKLEKCM